MPPRPAVIVFLLPMVPRGSSKFRGGPLCPLAFLLTPIFHRPNNTRHFETTETLGIGEGGKWETRGAKVRKARKMLDFRAKIPFIAFRGVPSGSVGFRGGPLCP